jgi:hypothetical protein
LTKALRHAPAAPSRAPFLAGLDRRTAFGRNAAGGARDLERARHPGIGRVIGGLERDEEHRRIAVAGARVRGFERVEDAAV